MIEVCGILQAAASRSHASQTSFDSPVILMRLRLDIFSKKFHENITVYCCDSTNVHWMERLPLLILAFPPTPLASKAS